MQLFVTAFKSVDDPRADNSSHDLVDILMIAFLAVLSGAQSCSEMAVFGETKLKFLKRFLGLKHGIPSHDTFSTVLRMIDPRALDAAFGSLSMAIAARLEESDVIAVDGKALKGAYDKGKSHAPRMMVSAFAAGLRLTLATVEAKGGNEVDAALDALGLIDLKGKIVTGDALHCNRKTVAAIVEKGGDYCLSLRANQDSLLSDARSKLANLTSRHPTAKSETKAHGRIETRVAIVVNAHGLAKHHEFAGLKAFGRIEETREIDGKATTEVRIFALSRKLSPQALLETARAHWQIENALHWQLDVSFREDAARNRKDNGPANIAVLRRRALDVVRRDQTKGSITEKLKRAGWNDRFLLKLLGHMR